MRRSRRKPDALWALIAPLVSPGTPHPLGRRTPRVGARWAMGAMFVRLRTGRQWNAWSATGLCSSSSGHRRCPKLTAAGVFYVLRRRVPRAVGRS